MPNTYRPSTSSAVVKIGLSNFYRLSTGFAALETGLPILYRASSGFTAVKMDLQQLHSFPAVKKDLVNFYKPSTGSTSFAVDKKVLTITYIASTTSWVVKTSLANIYCLLMGFLAVKMPCHSSTVSQQACGSQSSFVEPVQVFNSFAMVKMYIQNIYKPSTDSAVVKACSTILHRHSEGFVVVKT